MTKNPLISIILFSNNLENIKNFIKQHLNKSQDKSSFEILARVDEGDIDIKNYYDELLKLGSVNLKYVVKNKLNYFEGFIGNNDMIEHASDSSLIVGSYGDRIYPQTDNWDTLLLNKIETIDNEIFRICCSEYSKRSYHDIWEACFAPANVFYVSKKWLDINEDFGTCFSHDAFSQCVSYYVEKFDNFNSKQFNIDYPFHEIIYTGTTPAKKSPDEEYNRVKGQISNWNILLSARMQQIAKERAMKIVSNLLIQDLGSNYIMENIPKKKYILIYPLPKSVLSKDNIIKLNYKVSKVQLEIKKILRIFYFLNYTGGGFYKNRKSLLFNLTYYLSRKYNFLRNLNDIYNHYVGKFK